MSSNFLQDLTNTPSGLIFMFIFLINKIQGEKRRISKEFFVFPWLLTSFVCGGGGGGFLAVKF